MFWFIALFDEETEAKVKEIWRELKEQGLSYYIDEVKDGRPHITLASYEHLDREEYIREIDTFYDRVEKMEIMFNMVSSFLNYGTIFIAPTVTKDLLAIHSAHHQHFEDFNGSVNSLYFPGQWIPHCTVANQLEPDDLANVFQYCFTEVQPFRGKIEAVALIEVKEEDEEGMNAPVIYTKHLT
ncbi:2'-5' RNA ligase family protein [Guptibacillus spartinae]|uniref:2'-5' RNA ligase family protein n=1 Tax=Guptibacillus spartinae TaxID=3025679 RepID=UPI00235DDBED|nr:2'-5' RNA ligase family protein [Pseudalkalibacillus spartinae]